MLAVAFDPYSRCYFVQFLAAHACESSDALSVRTEPALEVRRAWLDDARVQIQTAQKPPWQVGEEVNLTFLSLAAGVSA